MWFINGKRTSNLEEVKKHFNLKYLPMTRSLLDQDLYKFSMGQCYHHQFASVKATWDFKARNVGDETKHEKYTEEDRKEILAQLNAYCALRFENEELEWLKTTCPWIHSDFTNFLKFWHPEIENITVEDNEKTGLSIVVAGVQEYVSFYEIPVLEIAAETYYRNHYDYETLAKVFKEKTLEKFEKLRDGLYDPGVFSEFGARRRVSYELQDWLIKSMTEEKNRSAIGRMQGWIGTSNVHLAMKYNTKPVGTMAHEIFLLLQAQKGYDPSFCNWFTLDAWVKEYGTWNGIALTDTIGTDVFLLDFGKTFATLFSGVRHDSGDPYEWGDKMIAHYKKHGINPMTKTLMFSDALDLAKATAIKKYFEGKAKVAFGIGTDWSGPQNIEPLNIVCKPALFDGKDTAKLSNSPGKCMCRNQDYIDYLQRSIDWRLKNEA